MYTWRFDTVWNYREVFLWGALVTMKLTFFALIFGLALGLILGLARTSKLKAINSSTGAYIELFRSTPVLMQLVWIYYCLPILLGIKFTPFISVVIGLSMNASAYFAEIYRAGIQSIEKGQIDAARSLGMNYLQAMRRVILPQAIRRMIPPFINEFANLIKLTSLASVLAIYELLHAANNLINNIYRPLEVYTVAAVMYFIIIYPLIFSSRRLESYLAQKI